MFFSIKNKFCYNIWKKYQIVWKHNISSFNSFGFCVCMGCLKIQNRIGKDIDYSYRNRDRYPLILLALYRRRASFGSVGLLQCRPSIAQRRPVMGKEWILCTLPFPDTFHFIRIFNSENIRLDTRVICFQWVIQYRNMLFGISDSQNADKSSCGFDFNGNICASAFFDFYDSLVI